jgi:hypothetical protein
MNKINYLNKNNLTISVFISQSISALSAALSAVLNLVLISVLTRQLYIWSKSYV